MTITFLPDMLDPSMLFETIFLAVKYYYANLIMPALCFIELDWTLEKYMILFVATLGIHAGGAAGKKYITSVL